MKLFKTLFILDRELTKRKRAELEKQLRELKEYESSNKEQTSKKEKLQQQQNNYQMWIHQQKRKATLISGNTKVKI